jgi:DNA-binding winged helix-turn-helix (wHTH) protein
MIYVFGEYVLDVQRYELRHGGTLCPLEPQAFNVLAYLVQHRDRVVTKQELLERLWPAQHVGEAILIQRVVAVRKAIGDSGRTQRLVKTVHSRGYRFIAEVEERVGAAVGPVADHAEPGTLAESAAE